jgi:O-acetyl-ADP-ribose deacetylase (regulator of RNase III)
MIKTVKGDLVELAKQGDFDLIAHGCNCFCTMGAGIAKQIKREFPQAYAEDMKTVRGHKGKLGTCSYYEIDGLVVVNAYTQYDFKGRGVKVDYRAVCKCMNWIAENFRDRKIGLPKIGAGLAGGDWGKILKIIEDKLKDCDVTIVEFSRG